MREIRFRAWHKASRRMFDVNAISKTTVEELRNGVSFRYYRDDVVLMQYTGLKDKDGKEIYEGDVVGAFCDTQRFEIKYCEERGGYFLDSVVLCGGAEPAPECLGNLLDTVEVIGNIHDNPELLVTDDA